MYEIKRVRVIGWIYNKLTIKWEMSLKHSKIEVKAFRKITLALKAQSCVIFGNWAMIFSG